MLKFSQAPSADSIAIVKGGPWNNRIVDLVDDIEREDDEEVYKGIQCPEGSSFMPMPNHKEEQRDVIYVTGASGTGKSTFASDYADLFVRMFKLGGEEPKIVIVSPDDPEHDAVFRNASYDWEWISPEDILTKNITMEDMCDPEFRNTYKVKDKKNKELIDKLQPMLIIFDDTEALSNKKESTALHTFMKSILERARKRGIYALYVSHRAANGPATKVILSEQTGIWFPLNGTGGANLSYMLNKHMNIPDELRKILCKNQKEFGRWAYIKTDGAPRYAITPVKMFIIDDDEILGKK